MDKPAVEHACSDPRKGVTRCFPVTGGGLNNMKRRSFGVLAAPVVVSMLAILPTASPDAQATTAGHRALPASCLHSFNPYKASMSRVKSCGGLIYPLVRVRPLPGGGHIYSYDMNGVMSTKREPPRGFRPLTATNAQLLRYGFPPRPGGGGQPLATWASMMRRIGAAKPTMPPAYLVGDPLVSFGSPGATSSAVNPEREYWAGNSAVASSDYDEVAATYNEPQAYSSQCATTAMSQWVGLGAFNPANYNVPLVQAGTSIFWPGKVNTDEAFYQIFGITNPVPEPLYATTGQPFYVNVFTAGGQIYFYWYNDDGGSYANAQYPTPSTFVGNSAEMMVERAS
ncbi:MAG: G1 family glutamic endopeptidase [Streptosporangiaceae bacterium]